MRIGMVRIDFEGGTGMPPKTSPIHVARQRHEGQSELDELLAERDQINVVVRNIIDQGTDPWGIEVTGVEIKDIDLPHEMKRAMAKQAEAERERRGKVIAAQGELQASRELISTPR